MTSPLPGSGLLRGFHGGLVAHPESASDGGPGVACIPRFLDELGTPGGHAVHPVLERGEDFEDVFGHARTVTTVAVSGQVCNHGYMHNEPCPISNLAYTCERGKGHRGLHRETTPDQQFRWPSRFGKVRYYFKEGNQWTPMAP